MPPRAKVSSTEVLEEFRARLIVYASQARSALEEVSADLLRVRSWIENEQRVYWEQQLRRRARELDEAQQALFSAKMSNLREDSTLQQLTVQRAKRAVEECQAKLRVLKQWNRDFENRVQPLVKQMEKLHTVLTNDMVQAAASLAQTITTLAAYAGIAPPSGAAATGGNSAPASETGGAT